MSKPLPPDPDGMAAARTRFAQGALWAFQKQTHTDDEDAVCDLLCDLMHWCDYNDTDFADQYRRASYHYEAETRLETGT
jgi:hypothetical protein